MAGNVAGGGGRRGRGRRMALWAGAIGLILSIPLVAMQFTEEVQWTAFDFALAAAILGSVATAFEVTVSATRNFAHRAAVAVALAAAFLLIWINGAVGIIGSENNDANLMFAGVLAVACFGALMADFRPAGMARAMTAAALAQASVGAIALAAGLGAEGENWPRDVVGLTLFFAAMWLISAALFRRVGREQA